MNITWYCVLAAFLFCIGGAGVLTRRNPLVILLCLELMLNAGNLLLIAFSRMHGNGDGQVFALIVHLVSLAGLFLILHAEFVAAAQVVVYAGAVMVLYVFVAAYVGGVQEPAWEPIPGQQFLAPLLGSALFVELSIAVLGSSLKALDTNGPTIPTASR